MARTNIQIVFFLVPQDAALREALVTQTNTIVALTKGCQSSRVVDDAAAIPKGCGSAVLSADLTIFIDVAVCGIPTEVSAI